MSRPLRLVGLSDAEAEVVRRTRRDEHGNHELAAQVVAEPHSTPCRVCLRDAAVGEAVLLFGHSPFVSPHPYRTVGPVFIHAAPCLPYDGPRSVVPDALRIRLLSVRAYDRTGRLLDSEVTPGDGLLELAGRLLAVPEAHELHVHHARPGCFACRIVPA